MSKFSIPKFEVEHNGQLYNGELAKVESFTLGREDHGIFTAMVQFHGEGWGQGLPAMGLGVFRDEKEAAASLDYIIRLIDTLGSPENAKGTRVVVFRQGDEGWFGKIAGFATLNADGSYNEPFWNTMEKKEK